MMLGCFSVAGIETKEIVGFVKGSQYEPGEKLNESDKSVWSAVLIDGSWQLTDVHWSSKHVSGVEKGDWELIDDDGRGTKAVQQQPVQEHYMYDEAYFLTSPEEFIFTHLPGDTKWQLLARPVSKDEFMKLAYLKGEFFKYGLRINSHRQCIVSAKDGKITFEFSLPIAAQYKFSYRLWISTKDKQRMQTHNKTDLKRYVFMEYPKGLMRCSIDFPVKARYKLDIACMDVKLSETTYKFVCTYIIEVDQVNKDVKPLPDNIREEWGPGPDLAKVGIAPMSHKSGRVQIDTGEVEMKFSTENEVNFKATACNGKHKEEKMEKYLRFRSR